jgi:class 3 adenylate cyclase/tetratricopeptide (TPR) repeat protein
MTFDQLLDAATELLRRRGRLTYGALKRQFDLDDAALSDLKDELILGQRLARDEGGTVLVWAESGADEGHAASSAAVGMTPGASASAADTRTVAAAHTPPGDAERRQLTILFCDLADSTTLSNLLDVEDMRAVLRRFQDCAGAVMARHQGFVNSFLGDGIVAFFGYPQAREDDARRAVRAGLDLCASVAGLGAVSGQRLRVRVGIATGVVVVGDVIGQGPSREEAVVGSTSNLAARLQAAAQPGEVVIAGSTHRLCELRFECDDLGALSLKGFPNPVNAWRVKSERALETVAETLQAAHLRMPLVGREIELPALLRAWQQARSGSLRVVTLRGEAGLGKSRLTEALCEQAAGDEPLFLRYFCASHFQNTALHPVQQQVLHAAAISPGDDDETRLAKLASMLSLVLDNEERERDLPYIAAALSLPTLGRYAPVLEGPERLRELTLRALQNQVWQHAKRKPVLMVFEDLHWADPTTLALIDGLARCSEPARVLVLCTTRPGTELRWSDEASALTIDLTPLKRNDRAHLAAAAAGGKALPPEIVEHIVAKSDGNPLFVEELTKTLLESGLLREEATRYVLTGPIPAQAVPASLQDSLLSRLDRLGPAKEVAQAGAALGREFAYPLLAAVVKASGELNAALGRLVEAELVQARGVPPQASYTFKHALIQDAAYATMLRAKRQALHGRIAEVLEADAHVAKEAPELLAHHLAEAHQPARAIPYLVQAGLRASSGAALQEACKHLQHGIELLPAVADEGLRQRLELPLRLHMGLTLSATQGFSSPDVEAAQQRALTLCQAGAGSQDELFWVLRALGAVYIVRGDMREGRDVTGRCLQMAQQIGRPECLVEGLLIDCYSQGFSGDYVRTCEQLSRLVHLYKTTDAGRFLYPTPQDPLMAALALGMVMNHVRGDIDAGNANHAELVRMLGRLSKPFDQGFALVWLALYEVVRGRPDEAMAYGSRAVAVSQQYGIPTWLATGAMNLGMAKAMLGQNEEAVALIGGTIPGWLAAGAELNVGWFRGGLARAQLQLGQPEVALASLNEGLADAQRCEEFWCVPELLRQRAALHAEVRNDRNAARSDLEDAVALAQRQGARLWQLRAATDLARLLPGPERATARRVLGDALTRFPMLPDLPEVHAAQALMAALA